MHADCASSPRLAASTPILLPAFELMRHRNDLVGYFTMTDASSSALLSGLCGVTTSG